MEISLKRHRSNLNAVIKVKKKKKRSTWHEKQKLLVFSLSEAAVLKEKKMLGGKTKQQKNPTIWARLM